MRKMRLPLLIALGVAIIGIILGSFFDLQISTAIASPKNVFGLTVSAIGPTIGFGGVAVMGGVLVLFADGAQKGKRLLLGLAGGGVTDEAAFVYDEFIGSRLF